MAFERIDQTNDIKLDVTKFEAKMEAYTKLTRFVQAEARLDDFVTVKNNEQDLKEREEKFSLIWKTLDRDYFTQEEIDEKFDDASKYSKDTYNTIATHVDFVTRNKDVTQDLFKMIDE